MSEILEDNMVYPEDGLPFCKDCGYLNSCRCSWCSRCGQLTGNNTQGHYWAHCQVTKTTRDFHFCCPDACQLEGIEPTKPWHPRHLAFLEALDVTEKLMEQAEVKQRQRAQAFLDGLSLDYKLQYPDMIDVIAREHGLDGY